MFIKIQRRSSRRAFTITELVMTMSLSLIVVGAVLSGFVFASKNMLWLSNSASLTQNSQVALDKLTREIRSMGRVVSYARTGSGNPPITSITFAPENSTNTADYLQLEYIPDGKRLIRRRSGQSESMLADCQSLDFSLFQRVQTNGSFSAIQTTNASLAKLIRVHWICSRYSGPSRDQFQASQSAQIVMRTK